MISVLIGSLVYVQIERIMVDIAYRSNSAMLDFVKGVMIGAIKE
jgi:hypothetical protein